MSRPLLDGGYSGYDVAGVTSVEDFAALREEWDDLLTRCAGATPFQTFEWQWSWWTALGHGRRLFIVTVRESGGALVALAPLMISRRSGLRVVEFLGTGLSDYLDVIVAGSPEGIVGRVFDHLLRQGAWWDVACLQTPETAVASADEVRRVAAERGLRVQHRVYEIAPFLAIGGSWDDFVKGKAKKFRYALRERLARFTAQEGAALRRIEGADVGADLAAPIWEIERHSWKARAGTSPMRSPRVREFYGQMLAAFGKRGWAHVWLASLRERPVAYVLGFVFGGRTYLYAISYDAAFDKLAPGMLLLQESIRAAFDEKASEYDFLCGDEPYKDRWTRDRRRVLQTVVARPTLRAWLGAGVVYRARWALARSDRLRAMKVRLIGWQSRFTTRQGRA